MPRVKRGSKRRTRIKKLHDLAEGFFLGRRTQYRRMVEAVRASLTYQYDGRKARKRDFRALWVARLNAAAVENEMSYSAFMGALIKSKIGINRKMLSEIAIQDPSAFSVIVNQVRSNDPTTQAKA